MLLLPDGCVIGTTLAYLNCSTVLFIFATNRIVVDRTFIPRYRDGVKKLRLGAIIIIIMFLFCLRSVFFGRLIKISNPLIVSCFFFRVDCHVH